MSKRQIKAFFKNDDLSKIKGVLVTTAGKICDNVHYEQCYDVFNKNIDKKKISFDDPIKMVGRRIVKVKLHPQVTVELTVEIAGE